jgi:outer membrane immunogenic protein
MSDFVEMAALAPGDRPAIEEPTRPPRVTGEVGLWITEGHGDRCHGIGICFIKGKKNRPRDLGCVACLDATLTHEDEDGDTVLLEYTSGKPVPAGEIFHVDKDIPLPAAEAHQLGARGAMALMAGQYPMSLADGGRRVRVELRVRGEWASAPRPVAAHGFGGVRAEARIGYETPTVSGDGDVFRIDSAVSYGAEIGYDARLGRSVVAGPYATYEFSSIDLCADGFCLSESGTLGVGARLGFAVSPRVLAYGKLGYARTRFTFRNPLTAAGGTASGGGVQGAIGINLELSRHIYGLAEVNYSDFGTFLGVNLQRRHVAAGIGVRF